ncbi:MAG: hypothetical protein KME35_23110 [Aphanocapsa sp. GSE-SYN-MK-11-07L]|nr:hypothetical protein [Aphanocapsa sp. GSE-SYN-MK-11-07L]
MTEISNPLPKNRSDFAAVRRPIVYENLHQNSENLMIARKVSQKCWKILQSIAAKV